MSEFRFSALLGALERAVVEPLQLTPLPLPAELTQIEGSWKDAPVTLAARAYRSPRVRYARFVTVSGDTVDIANLLVLPEPGDALPMLGADLVALGRDTALIVADLSPATSERAALDRQRAVVSDHLAGVEDLAGRSEPPEWCRPWFSADALCARIALAEREHAAARLMAMCRAFTRLSAGTVGGTTVSGGTARAGTGRNNAAADEAARQQAYCTSHLTDDRALQMLGRMFEPARASRFLQEVLFPVEGQM